MSNAFLASPEYTAALQEVAALGSSTSTIRTQDQSNIAYFWMDGPGTASPPGHWNRIAQDVSGSLGIEDKARLFALLNLAEADTAIATWETKRYYDFWRPMQAIAQADIDGNAATTADTGWSPLIPTPRSLPTPAVTAPLARQGQKSWRVSWAPTASPSPATANRPFSAGANSYRTFNSFSEAADEAGMSRIYRRHSLLVRQHRRPEPGRERRLLDLQQLPAGRAGAGKLSAGQPGWIDPGLSAPPLRKSAGLACRAP